MLSETILAAIIWIAGIAAAIYVYAKTKTKVGELIKAKGYSFDYGLASKKEVLEKFGDEIGTVIIEERRIVFWKFSWLWAVIGAAVYAVVEKIVWG